MVVLSGAPPLLATEAGAQPSVEGSTTRNVDEGVYLLHDLGNGQHVQVVRQVIDGNAVPMVALVPLGIDGFDRIESIQRLLAALHGRTIPADTRLTRQQRSRARRMLQAFDGFRDGASQQEIAQVIFKIGRLERDAWQVSSARHAVMSLLRDARALIGGGYRNLLRHRRRF